MEKSEGMLEDAMTREALLERMASEMLEIQKLEDAKKKTNEVAAAKIKTRQSIVDMILKRIEDDDNGIQRLPGV